MVSLEGLVCLIVIFHAACGKSRGRKLAKVGGLAIMLGAVAAEK
jgi:hypothetical protein